MLYEDITFYGFVKVNLNGVDKRQPRERISCLRIMVFNESSRIWFSQSLYGNYFYSSV